MKKITFKVTAKKEGGFVSLIKKVNKISCRIQIDLENGLVAVENADNTMIDSVIELIDEYYSISNVMINNTSDESTVVEDSQSVAVVDESKSDVDVEEKVEEKVEENVESKSNPTVVGPQSEHDLIIQKVEFENEYVEDSINRFLRTAYWAMYKKNVPAKEITDFIWNSINEISMKYNPTIIEYSVGDIVECNYGNHLGGEVNGGRVFALVCNKAKGGMAYLVPIFRIKKNVYSLSWLSFNVPNDVVYNNYNCNRGVALLDKGRYVREERIIAIRGKATPEFLAKVLDKLITTFDFRGNTVMTNDTKTDYDDEISEVVEQQDEIVGVETNVAMDKEKVETNSEENVTDCDVVESNSVDADNSDVTTTEPKPKKTVKKIGSEESALLDIIGESLKKLDPTKKVEKQVYNFLTDIGMTTSEKMVTQAFVLACDIDRISYDKVILKLHNMFPKVNERIIKSILKGNFKKWLDLHPELVKSCPKISFISVLKVFAKRFS